MKAIVDDITRTWVLFAIGAIWSWSPNSIASEPKSFSIPPNKNMQTDFISDLCFSPDGTHLAVACGRFEGSLQKPQPGRIIIWEVRRGEVIANLSDHSDGVSSVVFSPDGKFVAAGGYDGLVKLWNLEKLEENRSYMTDKSPIDCLSFAPDGKRMAIGLGGDLAKTGNLVIWNVLSDQKVLKFHGHSDGVTAVAFSGDAKHFASAAWDGTIGIWNEKTQTIEKRFPYGGGGQWAFHLIFSPDSKILVGVGGASRFQDEWSIRLWSTTSWEIITEKGGNGRYIASAQISSSGAILATATDSGEGRLWDMKRLTDIRTIPGKAYRVAFSPDRNIVAVAGERTIRLWTIDELTKK